MESAKKVFIAGCDSEIGFYTARTLVEQGFCVWAAMKSPGFLNQIYASDLLEFSLGQPGQLHILELDVTSGSSVSFAATEAFKLADSEIDVLINAEDMGSTGFSETFTVEQFKNLFDINVFGFQRLCRSFLPQMRKRKKGLIICISSIFGRMALPYAGAYTAAKFALDGLVESYRIELKPMGLEVTMVETGGFDAAVTENMLTMADDLERVKTYGEYESLPRSAWNQIKKLYDFSDEGPEAVADVIVELIAQEDGIRPGRIVVPDMPGSDTLEKLNQHRSNIQNELLALMDLELA